MSVDIYTLVESLLRQQKTLSRNRYHDAYSDADFSRAMRLRAQLQTVIDRVQAGDQIDVEHTTDGVQINYRGEHPLGDFRREVRLTPEAFGILTRLVPSIGEPSSPQKADDAAPTSEG